MEKPEVKPAVCEVGQGTLPGCAALAFPYIPMQSNNPTRYSRTEALQTGTLFPGLDLPFKASIGLQLAQREKMAGPSCQTPHWWS